MPETFKQKAIQSRKTDYTRLQILCTLFVSLTLSATVFFLGQELARLIHAREVSFSEEVFHQAKTALARLSRKELTNSGEQRVDDAATKDNFCKIQDTLKRVKLCTYLVKTDLGHGSAFAIDQHYLVTNKHVVEGASKLNSWIDQEKIDLKLWGFSQNSDLAVLRSEVALEFCDWSDSNQIPLAAEVYAVGWPHSPEGDSSITKGIFSRFVNTTQGPTFIQTDAAINPGNSGGPLIDACGVVGINTAKIVWSEDNVPTQGFSFAISSNFAQGVVEELIASGREHTLPVQDLGEVEYSLAQQRVTPPRPRALEPAEPRFVFTPEGRDSWIQARDATRELVQYWTTQTHDVNRERYEKLKDILARMEAVIKQVVPKIEAGESLSEAEHELLQRWQEMYRQVVQLEGELHNQDYSRGYAHWRCQNNACTKVSGRGIDSCSTGQDCAPKFFYRCQGLTCVVAEGEGENECTSHDDCYYYRCEEERCIKEAGQGEDECYFDWQC